MVEHTQLLFPFLSPFYLSHYIAQEVPFIHEKKREYAIRTQINIGMNDFLAEHYCNPDSTFFSAKEFADTYSPLQIHDGEIVKWETYLR
jgi:hypothetical protein